MKSFNSTTMAAMTAGHIAKRDMIMFDFTASSQGLFGFWTGQGVLTYNGLDYIGAGRLMQFDSIGSASDLSAVAITARLSSVPDTDLTPDLLSTIEGYAWHQSPVIISRAYIDIDTRAVLSVERIFRGYFDKLEHAEQIGSAYTLVAYFESKARDHLKSGFRVRGDADQRRVNVNDNSLQYVAVAGSQTINWGRVSSVPHT
jgi:hypothetical protein